MMLLPAGWNLWQYPSWYQPTLKGRMLAMITNITILTTCSMFSLKWTANCHACFLHPCLSYFLLLASHKKTVILSPQCSTVTSLIAVQHFQKKKWMLYESRSGSLAHSTHRLVNSLLVVVTIVNLHEVPGVVKIDSDRRKIKCPAVFWGQK